MQRVVFFIQGTSSNVSTEKCFVTVITSIESKKTELSLHRGSGRVCIAIINVFYLTI